jgi:uncharacterized protein YfdQ (DUF2303 family)
MLSPETIDRLQAGAVSTAAKDLKTHIPAVVLMDGPGKTKVESIEHLQEGRSLFRGTFATNSIKDFVRYVESRKGAPRGFIAAEKIEGLSCRMFFNLGDDKNPGHGNDIADLNPKMMPAFAAMRAICGKKLTQQELIDWVEDWHHVVSAQNAGEAFMGTAEAVAGIRSMKIDTKGQQTSTVNNFGAARSAMEEVEANRDGGMPAFLTLRTEPFERLMPRSFVLRVSILTGGDKPALTLRWQRQEHQCEEIAQEFKELLVSELGGLSDSLVVGTFTLGK